MIDLNINPTVATKVGETTGADGQKLPTIAKRNLATSALVKEGFTVVVGGLMQKGSSLTIKETPFISKVPLLGLLFKNQSTTKTRSNLIILVTPRVIRSDSFEAGSLSPEDRNALSEASEDSKTTKF